MLSRQPFLRFGTFFFIRSAVLSECPLFINPVLFQMTQGIHLDFVAVLLAQ